jgi:capsular polysaccharide biosynthesis protein
MYEFENDDEIEIDLRELFLALKKKIAWILLTAIVFAGAAGLITKFAMTPVYSSSAQLYVMSKGGISQLTDLTMGTQLTQDYMVIVKTRPVLEQVIEDLHLDMDYKELGNKITVENPSDTRIMQITVTDKDPEVAKDITQDLAEVTADTVAKKMDVKSPTIIEKAYKAESPDSPSLKKNIVIGALLGFILMAAVIVIQYLMNDTILKEEDIEKYLGINTLAQLPLVKGAKKRTKKVKRAR